MRMWCRPRSKLREATGVMLVHRLRSYVRTGGIHVSEVPSTEAWEAFTRGELDELHAPQYFHVQRELCQKLEP